MRQKSWFLRGNQAEADNNINLLLIAAARYDAHAQRPARLHTSALSALPLKQCAVFIKVIVSMCQKVLIILILDKLLREYV